ncbi:MAG: RNA-binding transcriptional accessory protein [Acholeplasmatales bacterium]|nr:RNA-binding transcriptional accessory protein [Acholeplasmatales bacterium]
MSELVVSENVIDEVSKELNCKKEYVLAVLEMLSEDKTVAFIARYRKEATGGLDEEEIRKIDESYKYGVNLEKRKNDVIRLIEEKGLLTDDLKNQITSATKLIEVEDLYRPYKEKKKTKATEAIAAGLDGLADIMLKLYQRGTKEEYVNKFLNDKVKTYDDAIIGAKYIVAERISDNAEYRKYIRDAALKYGTISCKKKAKAEDIDEKYANYYDSSENVGRIKPHRVLAINRAEDEGVINVSITLQPERDLDYLSYKITKKRESLFKNELLEAIADSYKRLISPSIEREIRSILSEKAEEQAIKIFSLNLKNILLQAPMKGKTVLGIDPAYRTGCKLAVISPASQVLEIGVIYPNERSKDSKVDPKEVEKSKKTIVNLIKKYNVSIIAIGNGTAGRETEAFVAEIINENKLDVKYVMVSEAGASVYSASELAIEEFPDLTVEKRSAISIARRIQDPLAELIKIDPKSIGVGQYQHDVTQSKLEKSLGAVVDDAVNRVGVNLNTASISLLSYVSGLKKDIAKNIVAFRDANGRFNSREELKKVSKMGPKTYEQCVGFLRIIDGNNKLDMTPIHPESYGIALKLLKKMNLDADALGTKEIKDAVAKLDKMELVKELNTDIYTLNDILDAFVAPLRDVRDDYQGLILRSDIMHFEDIKVGDELDGVVRNVVDFGAFVDCGVKYDGLVHISKMSNDKIKHPSDILSVGDNVHVYVIDIDYTKHKMALSLVKELK